MKYLVVTIMCMFMFLNNSVAEELTEKTYKQAAGKKGIVIVAVNWSRKWGCGKYENAQLYELVFSKIPVSESSEDIRLETNSKLAPNKGFQTVVRLIEPGTYALSEFDIKAVKSVNDIGHFQGNKGNLFAEDKPLAGTFDVAEGEVVYIGHFYIDCAYDPMPWRFYFDDKKDFEAYAAKIKDSYPLIKDEPINFRLFETDKMGVNFKLPIEGMGSN